MPLMEALALARRACCAPSGKQARTGPRRPGRSGESRCTSCWRRTIPSTKKWRSECSSGWAIGWSSSPTGCKPLEALEADDFDVVLMDLQMPRMDGLRGTRAIREREAGRGVHTHVAALTAHAMEGDRDRCLEAGFDNYLAKPVRQSELQAVLDAVHRPDPVADDSVVDGLKEICGGDDEFARELATSFLESAPRCLAGIDEALRSGDRGSSGRGSSWLEGDQPDNRRPAIRRQPAPRSSRRHAMESSPPPRPRRHASRPSGSVYDSRSSNLRIPRYRYEDTHC